MALTELTGTELGTQTVTIEQGPVRAFASAVKDDPDRYTGAGAPTPPTWPFVMTYWGSMGSGRRPPACRSRSCAARAG